MYTPLAIEKKKSTAVSGVFRRTAQKWHITKKRLRKWSGAAHGEGGASCVD